MKIPIPEESFEKAVFLLQPSRPILCTTKNEDGSDHVAPFSWINPISYKPPRVGLALLNSPKKQHSLVNIERTHEFVINLPDIKIADALVMASFWPVFGENKFDRSAFYAPAFPKSSASRRIRMPRPSGMPGDGNAHPRRPYADTGGCRCGLL